MDGLLTLFQALGSSGLYVSRAFGPLFVLSLSSRVASQGSGLGLLARTQAVPGWFTSDAVLLLLGLLALAELAAVRNRELRTLMRTLDVYYKPLAAVVGFLGSHSTQLQSARTDAASALAGGLPHLDVGVLATVVFGSTLGLSVLRKRLADAIEDHVGDEDLGLRRAGAWFDELWTLVGPALFVLFPLLVVVLTALFALAFGLLRRQLRAREERAKVACACGHANYRAALCCAKCGVANDGPVRLGLFGQSTDQHATDRVDQEHLLFAHRRCSRCATRLPKRDAAQACIACHHVPGNPVFLRDYQRWIGRRLPRVLLVTAVLGAVPLLGTVAGIVYYRLGIVAPYRNYVPLGQALLLRWGLRLAWIAVLSVQFVPGVGIVGLPLMAFISYRWHRVAFERAVCYPSTPTTVPLRA